MNHSLLSTMISKQVFKPTLGEGDKIKSVSKLFKQVQKVKWEY